MSDPDGPHAGGCLCGAVRFEVHAPLRPVAFCHCSQCRRQSGLYYAATATSRDALTVRGERSLKWYAASPEAKRGFCSECGSALFWARNDPATRISILAGAFDDGTPLRADRHIYLADKPDWYEIGDDLPRHPGAG